MSASKHTIQFASRKFKPVLLKFFCAVENSIRKNRLTDAIFCQTVTKMQMKIRKNSNEIYCAAIVKIALILCDENVISGICVMC